MAKKAYIGVPETYTVLEYIESSGTQYIDTGFVPNQDTKLVMRVMPTTIVNAATSNGFVPYGSSDSSTGDAYESYTWNNNHEVNYNGQRATLEAATANIMLTITHDKNVFTLVSDEGTTMTKTFTYNKFTAPRTMLLFATHRSTPLKGKQKIYSCQIYDDGTLIRDYVPCAKANGTVGLYDRVNGMFYGNVGTGSFTAGTVTGETISSGVARKIKKGYIGIGNFTKRELPSGYTQVEYLESSGTQYIDTEFMPNQNSRAVVDVQFMAHPTSHSAVLGSYDSTNTWWTYYRYDDNQYRASTGGTTQHKIAYADPTVRTTLSIKKGTFSVGGTEIATTNTDFNIALNVYLFALNRNAAVYYPAACRIFSCQLYDGDSIVRDYVPCTNANGTAGLYDMANAKFYGNAGSGTFTVGSSTHTVGVRKIKKAYIGIGGVARPCWSGGELAYYGTVTSLSAGRQYAATATVGDYGLFGGGYGSSGYVTNVDVYNSSLTHSSKSLSYKRRCAAASTENHALFAGGGSTTSAFKRVDAFDASLTSSSATTFTGRDRLTAASVGKYAVFAGGSASKTVEAYDDGLTKTTATTLSKGREEFAATTNGNYAIFGGGYNGDGGYLTTVDAYDANLTRSNPTNLSVGRSELSATTVGKYALFCGGQLSDYGGEVSNVVDAYDTSLTRTIPTPLSVSRHELAATTIGEYALIGGGDGWADYYNTVEVYDISLTKTVTTALSVGRVGLSALTIGKYALFAGGANPDNTYKTSVDAYTVD